MNQLFQFLKQVQEIVIFSLMKRAKPEMAIPIVFNGKTQRPSVCNAIETILIDEKWFKQHGSELLKALKDKEVKIIGDETVCQAFSDANLATEEDWETEYLGLTVSVKVIKCE